jgi:tRNA (cmo5U34)-methyltransferase
MNSENLEPVYNHFMNEIPWNEAMSGKFIDLGRYFVPMRELQYKTLTSLVGLTLETDSHANVIDLCCGEGLLAAILLEQFPNLHVYGYDGSPAMLEKASTALSGFGERFSTRLFDLSGEEWRVPTIPVQVVVSSLAIHHLDAPAKKQLYLDMFKLLEPGGLLAVADLIQPEGDRSQRLAADCWDETVRRRALTLDGTLQAYETFTQEQWNIFHTPDPMDKPERLRQQLDWMEEAGFSGCDVFWLYAGHAVFGGWKAGQQ